MLPELAIPGGRPPQRLPLHEPFHCMLQLFHAACSAPACAAAQYRGRHGQQEMERWARHAQRWAAQGRQVWLAFNNDNLPEGEVLPAAVADCQQLAAALRRCGAWPRV